MNVTNSLFLLLTLVMSILLFVLWFNKEINKPSFLYSFGIFTTFYTTPLYYIFGGTAYSSFSTSSLNTYLVYCITAVFLYIPSYVLSNNFFKNKKLYLPVKDVLLLRIYFFVTISSVLCYYLYFIKDMPLVHMFTEGEVIARPDTTGSIPFFFTFSSIGMVVLPSAYFYYIDKITKKYHHILINMVIIGVLVVAGHKGLVVYYFIFSWVYILKAKVDFKFILMVLGLFYIYMITKGLSMSEETFEYLTESPFRRFFVSQGSGFIHRVDLIEYNYIFESAREIKQAVFDKIYQVSYVGSSPAFFSGDILVQYGYVASLASFVFVSVIIISLSRAVYILESTARLSFLWGLYILIYLLVMSGIETNLYRFLLVLVNLSMLIFLSRLRFRF